MDVKTMKSSAIAISYEALVNKYVASGHGVDATSMFQQMDSLESELDRRDAELARFAALKEALEVLALHSCVSIYYDHVSYVDWKHRAHCRVEHTGGQDSVHAAIIEAAKAVRSGQ